MGWGKKGMSVWSALWLMGRWSPWCWWLLSGQKALAAKEQWKELKATYQEYVEAITGALTQALPMMEETQRKRVQLQGALEQLQAKVS